MGDPNIVANLKTAAEDALARGFKILTCEPRTRLLGLATAPTLLAQQQMMPP